MRLALPWAALALAACSSESVVNKYVPNIITPYRMDIQQGNFVTQDMVDKLQKGQTREQVRFILGTPLLTDAFHASRWDYVFRSAKGWNDPEKHSLTVFFGPDEKLDNWVGDVPPPKSMSPVAEDKGFFGWFSKSSPPKPAPVAAPAAPATGDAGAVSPPPAAAPAPQATAAPDAAIPIPAPAPAAAPANAPAIGAATQSQPDKKEPGLLRRMFGWMPGVSTEDSAASANRAASPDNVPTPRPSISQPPPPVPPAEPAAPTLPPGGAVAPPAAPSPSGAAAPAPAAPSVPSTPAPAAPPAAASAATLSAPPMIASPLEAPAAARAVPVVESSAPIPAQPAAPVAVPAEAPAAAPAPAPAAIAPLAPATPEGVLASIERWRAAWQAKNVTAYLAAYAPDFRPANNLTRAKWEAQRRERLGKPSFIVVKVREPQITLGSDDVAVAVFVQEYESNTLKESGRKTLRMARFGLDWLIIEEISK